MSDIGASPACSCDNLSRAGLACSCAKEIVLIDPAGHRAVDFREKTLLSTHDVTTIKMAARHTLPAEERSRNEVRH